MTLNQCRLRAGIYTVAATCFRCAFDTSSKQVCVAAPAKTVVPVYSPVFLQLTTQRNWTSALFLTLSSRRNPPDLHRVGMHAYPGPNKSL